VNGEILHTFKVLEIDAWTSASWTTMYAIGCERITGATRHVSQRYPLSAGLSQVAVDLTPMTASQPGGLLWLTADVALGVRLNDAAGGMLSSVYQLMLAMSTTSSLYLTPPASADATVRLELVGGGTIQGSSPTP
jgi:hypothetical protein